MLYIRFQTVETGKIRSMTKEKGHQKFSALKWKCFLENRVGPRINILGNAGL